jgi:hypothetical protein
MKFLYLVLILPFLTMAKTPLEEATSLFTDRTPRRSRAIFDEYRQKYQDAENKVYAENLPDKSLLTLENMVDLELEENIPPSLQKKMASDHFSQDEVAIIKKADSELKRHGVKAKINVLKDPDSSYAAMVKYGSKKDLYQLVRYGKLYSYPRLSLNLSKIHNLKDLDEIMEHEICHLKNADTKKIRTFIYNSKIKNKYKAINEYLNKCEISAFTHGVTKNKDLLKHQYKRYKAMSSNFELPRLTGYPTVKEIYLAYKPIHKELKKANAIKAENRRRHSDVERLRQENLHMW